VNYSLKERALCLLDAVENSDDSCCCWDFTDIRKALEQLPDPLDNDTSGDPE
jgi:hypothetical protein